MSFQSKYYINNTRKENSIYNYKTSAASWVFAIATTSFVSIFSLTANAEDATVDAIDSGQVSFDSQPEEIVVTGTRTSRKAIDSPVPIQLLSATELQETGKLNIRDALQELVPSYYNSAGWVGQAGEAVKTASLRGLQGDQSLVLINGERRHATSLIFYGAPTNNGASPADLDLIPASAIDHVEILTDGAAAQYGSDAIAGVINIILKKSAEGGDASFTYGRYASSPSGSLAAYGDTEQALFDQGLPIGDLGGFLHVSVDLSFHDNTNTLGPATAYNPKYGVTSTVANYTELFFPGDSRETTANRYVGDQGLPINQTYNFGYNSEVPVNDAVTFYSFATGSHQFAENFGIFRPVSSKQNIPSIYPNGFLPEFIVITNDFQINAGFKGDDLFGWHWKIGSSVSRADATERADNTINTSLGPTSPTNFYNGDAVTTEWVNTFDVNRPVDTGYFSSPLSVALGAEYRLDGYTLKPGQIESYEEGPYVFPAGYYYSGHPAAGASGLGGFTPNGTPQARSNIAGYIDLNQKLTDAWELGIAGRFEHYSDVGDTESGKISTRYQILPEIAIRASASNGFRAPSLQQEYYSSSIPNYIFVNGLGNILGNAYVSPPGSTIAKLFGAQPLKPETSKDYTVGFVFEPLDGWHATVDLYQIGIKNRIVQSGTITGAAVNTVLLANGLQPGSVAYYMNGVNTTTRGIDIASDYTTKFDDGWGKIKWSVSSAFNYSHIDKLPTTPSIVQSLNLSIFPQLSQQQLVHSFPKNRTTIGGLWSIDNFQVNLRESRYSGVNYPYQDTIATSANAGVPVYALDHADPKFITDLDITYTVNDSLRLTVGANNLFNTFPSQISQKAQLEYGWFAQNPVYNEYSPFGYNGGFYYARVSYSFGGAQESAPAQASYTPPPVVAPTPAAVARNYQVFFDFNKSDLTPDAVKVVDQAAVNATLTKVTRIDVTGHTDTVGSDAYNLRLSRRRAESVVAELQTHGVPSSEIAIYAKGKNDLLIPTADGVREPQNRRVQIVFEGGPTS